MSRFDPKPEDTVLRLPPMWSWQEFVDRAREPDTIDDGGGRHGSGDWPGASWEEALRLAQDGWTTVLPEVTIEMAELHEGGRDDVLTTVLVPTWDTTGSEVDVGAYLSGAPECMVDVVPQRMSTRGRVVTFLVPAGYVHTTPHSVVRHRGAALAALCLAIIATGHSVEIWSGYCIYLSDDDKDRYACAARVISAAEPLDIGRLMFALAHPAMLRRLWLGVWDSAPAPLARRVHDHDYGIATGCFPEDLPEGIKDPYIFPYLSPKDPQWQTEGTALAWCRETFVGLGLVRAG